jgi:hypothetical protein
MKIKLINNTHEFPMLSHVSLLSSVLRKDASNPVQIKFSLYKTESINPIMLHEWKWLEKKCIHFDKTVADLTILLTKQQLKVNLLAQCSRLKINPGFGELQYLKQSTNWWHFEKQLNIAIRDIQNTQKIFQHLSACDQKLSNKKSRLLERQNEGWTETPPVKNIIAKYDLLIEMPLELSTGINMVALSRKGIGIVHKTYSFWQCKSGKWGRVK